MATTLRRRRDTANDRLATAVFVAALVHGLVILGVKFTAPAHPKPSLPTLEVLLVPPGPDDVKANSHASYMAQRSQRGSGTGRDARRSSLPEARPVDDVPQTTAAASENNVFSPPQPRGAASVLARRELNSERLPAGAEASEPQSAAMARSAPTAPPLALTGAAADRELYLRGDRSADDRLLADTRESAIAGYLDGWKRRIERVGTLNFPNEARRRKLSGNPVLEVAIHADGTLQQVIVRRTSGHRELDDAAVGIVRLAAPFDPFPTAMRERYPVLRFAYEWQFLNGRLRGDATVFPTGP